MNSTAANDYSGVERSALVSLNVLELAAHILLDCPFAALNFYFVLPTSVLHVNFKFVLLCQSGCIFARGIVRLEVLLEDFFAGQIVSTDVGVWKMRAMFAPIYFRNYLAHVLVVERLMATLWARNYENRRNWHFSGVWFSVVLCLTTVNLFFTSAAQTDLLSWLTFGSVMALAFFEIFFFALLWKHNIESYERKWSKNQSLSERYQLSENVRTTKQMLPTLLFHVLNLFLGSAATTISFYRPFANKFCYDLTAQITLTAVSFSNFMIEFTMIIFHPFLRRRLQRMLENVANTRKCWRRVGRANSRIGTTTGEVGTEPNGGQNVILVNLHGELLRTEPTSQTDHFEVLRKTWEEMDKHGEKRAITGKRRG